MGSMNASEWWVDQVTVESPQGLAADGSRDQTWGNRRVIPCNVSAGQQKAQRPDGEVVMATHTIRCDQAIDIKDRLWLPGATVGDANQARRPIEVTSAKDLEGYVLYRVIL